MVWQTCNANKEVCKVAIIKQTILPECYKTISLYLHWWIGITQNLGIYIWLSDSTGFKFFLMVLVFASWYLNLKPCKSSFSCYIFPSVKPKINVYLQNLEKVDFKILLWHYLADF